MNKNNHITEKYISSEGSSESSEHSYSLDTLDSIDTVSEITVKKKRGRPKKIIDKSTVEDKPKRKRGRPKTRSERVLKPIDPKTGKREYVKKKYIWRFEFWSYPSFIEEKMGVDNPNQLMTKKEYVSLDDLANDYPKIFNSRVSAYNWYHKLTDNSKIHDNIKIIKL